MSMAIAVPMVEVVVQAGTQAGRPGLYRTVWCKSARLTRAQSGGGSLNSCVGTLRHSRPDGKHRHMVAAYCTGCLPSRVFVTTGACGKHAGWRGLFGCHCPRISCCQVGCHAWSLPGMLPQRKLRPKICPHAWRPWQLLSWNSIADWRVWGCLYQPSWEAHEMGCGRWTASPRPADRTSSSPMRCTTLKPHAASVRSCRRRKPVACGPTPGRVRL